MVEPDTGVLRILCLIDVGHKIKPSLLRFVIGFMREVCMCHCANCNFFSLEMNRNSLHLHSGGPMRHIRSHLSKVAMVAFFTLLCDRAKCSEFPSTRCVNHCSLHSSRVVTHLNCNCPIGIAGKFASCF